MSHGEDQLRMLFTMLHQSQLYLDIETLKAVLSVQDRDIIKVL